MRDREKSLFRKESLERLSSPEQLDQLMQVVSPKDWLPLSALAGLVILGIIWSIVGKIPITVQGQGILLKPRQIIKLESPISGQLQDINVEVGDCIQNNNEDEINETQTIIATLNPVNLKQQREQAEAELAQLQQQTLTVSSIEGERTQLETETLQQQRSTLQQRLQDARSLTPILQTRAQEAIQQQRNTLQQKLQDARSLTPILQTRAQEAIQQQRNTLQQKLRDARELSPVLKERLERQRELLALGAISKDRVLQVEREYRESLQDISDLEAQLKQLDLQTAETNQKYRENLANIRDLESQLKQLQLEETEAEQKYSENRNSIRELEAQLQGLSTQEKALEEENIIASTSRQKEVLEVRQTLQRLNQEIENNSTIKSSETGCILEVSATPGQVVSPGTVLGTLQVETASNELVGLTYFPIEDGKKIEAGMQILVTPSTVQRERFGGIVGEVVSVSPYPVTQQGAESAIANSEVVESIFASRPQIEVWVKLQEDVETPSGYEWSSSQGPNATLSSGTTAVAQVTVEQRSPISFVLPILREWSGIR